MTAQYRAHTTAKPPENTKSPAVSPTGLFAFNLFVCRLADRLADF